MAGFLGWESGVLWERILTYTPIASELLRKSLGQGMTKGDVEEGWICGYVCGEGVSLFASGQCGLLAGFGARVIFQSG